MAFGTFFGTGAPAAVPFFQDLFLGVRSATQRSCEDDSDQIRSYFRTRSFPFFFSWGLRAAGVILVPTANFNMAWKVFDRSGDFSKSFATPAAVIIRKRLRLGRFGPRTQ